MWCPTERRALRAGGGGEEADGQVAGSTKARGRLQNYGNRIDDDRSCGDIAVGAPWNGEADIRVASEGDSVCGVGGADIHLELEVDQFASFRRETSSNLVNASGLATFHGEEFGLDAGSGDFRLDRFRDRCDGKIQAVRNHGDRFGEADMLDHAFPHFGAKFVESHSSADFLLERKAPLGSIHDTKRFDMVDALRDSSESDDQLIHDESGIDASANQGDAGFFSGGIELRGELRIGAIGIGEFFAGGDDGRFGGEASEKLVHHFRERR